MCRPEGEYRDCNVLYYLSSNYYLHSCDGLETCYFILNLTTSKKVTYFKTNTAVAIQIIF